MGIKFPIYDDEGKVIDILIRNQMIYICPKNSTLTFRISDLEAIMLIIKNNLKKEIINGYVFL